jgi:hypothetical protein
MWNELHVLYLLIRIRIRLYDTDKKKFIITFVDKVIIAAMIKAIAIRFMHDKLLLFQNQYYADIICYVTLWAVIVAYDVCSEIMVSYSDFNENTPRAQWWFPVIGYNFNIFTHLFHICIKKIFPRVFFFFLSFFKLLFDIIIIGHSIQQLGPLYLNCPETLLFSSNFFWRKERRRKERKVKHETTVRDRYAYTVVV